MSNRRVIGKKGCVVYEYWNDDSYQDNLTFTPPEYHLTSIPCNEGSCDQEILLVNHTDSYCSRECFHKKTDNDRMEEHRPRTDDIKMTRLTIQGRGGTGLLTRNFQLDHLVIHVDELMGRMVKIQKEGNGAFRKAMKAFRSAKSSDKEVEVVNDVATKQANEETKRRLKELLNDNQDSSDATDTSDEEDNKYDEYLDDGKNLCPPQPPILNETWQTEKGYVINICNPWEIHIQTGDMIMKSHEIEDICNSSTAFDSRLRIEFWSPSIGGICCAKFEKNLYRGRILGKVGDSYRVKFVDYGNVDLVSANDIMQLNPELALVPAQCVPFRLSLIQPVDGTCTWDLKTNQFCIENLDGASVELDIDSVERGRLHIGKMNIISSISNKFKGDFGNILVQEGFAVLED